MGDTYNVKLLFCCQFFHLFVLFFMYSPPNRKHSRTESWHTNQCPCRRVWKLEEYVIKITLTENKEKNKVLLCLLKKSQELLEILKKFAFNRNLCIHCSTNER